MRVLRRWVTVATATVFTSVVVSWVVYTNWNMLKTEVIEKRRSAYFTRDLNRLLDIYSVDLELDLVVGPGGDIIELTAVGRDNKRILFTVKEKEVK